MSAKPQSQAPRTSPLPVVSYPFLPPVTITRQALTQFHLSLHQQLDALEGRFADPNRPLSASLRSSWKSVGRRPR